MTNFIKENQLKANLKNLNVEVDKKDMPFVLNVANKLHGNLVSSMLSKRKVLQHQQNGGRVSFPIDYFGGDTATLSGSTPSHTTSTGDHYLHDPSGFLGTDQALAPFVGGGLFKRYTLSQSAANNCTKHYMDSMGLEFSTPKTRQLFINGSKHAFEKVFTDVLNRSTDKDGKLSKSKIEKTMSLKKFNKFDDFAKRT